MHVGYHAQTGAASSIPINAQEQILSVSPITLSAPGRPAPLEVRATVPLTGHSLPIVIFSHGQGLSTSLSSLEGYAPLCEFWAAHGFAVIQPTHLSSAFLGLPGPSGQELWWQERARDISRVLDGLDAIEAAVPGLAGRLDRARAAVAGHSMGGLTSELVLGASNTDPRDGARFHAPEPRVVAGVLIGATGGGGAKLAERGRGLLPFWEPDFGDMKTPALVVRGSEDHSPWFSDDGLGWHADPYRLSPGATHMLTLKGAKHAFGGVSGWDVAETEDGSPERLGFTQRMTWAYLRSRLVPGDDAWERACEAFEALGDQGEIEAKN